ncbi:M15 family metallopeptidase [Nonomuraea sp. NPDC050556]|uniref:M15 family metallopeptidase n=1 Tax=Nonomuraea sp. NPDC050556 TaxID=3364369 RepID=UPI00379EA4E4
MPEPVLLSDHRISAIPVRECGERLVDLRTVDPLRLRPSAPDGPYVQVRQSVADRLVTAQTLLPRGLRLLVVEGYRTIERQEAAFSAHVAGLHAAHPDWPADRLHRSAARYVAPPPVAPHLAGAAVDVTLCTDEGVELTMGTEVGIAPEACSPSCHTASAAVGVEAGRNRAVLVAALEAVGMVNYPTQWWHWSFGDRYWAFSSGAPAARYDHVQPAPTNWTS